MRVKILTSLLTAAAGALALAGSAQALPAPDAASQISGAINNTQLVTLNRNTRPEANAANDRGVAPATMPMNVEILLKRTPAKEQAFAAAIAALSDPKSPTFHKWMTNAQIAKYGPSQADVTKISNWLTSEGLTVSGVTPDQRFIVVSGTAASIGATFHTSIHNLSVNGVAHFANVSDPKIPQALAAAVEGPVALHNFTGHSDAIKKTKPLKPLKIAKGTSSDGTLFYITPEDLATIYNLKPLFAAGINGKGQTIVVLEDTNVFKAGDFNTFRAVTGLSAYKDAKFTQVHPAGMAICSDPGVNGDEGEAAIDVDWASAAAPDANIELASCGNSSTIKNNTGFGGFLALQNLTALANPPKIISLSYGECEVFNGAASNKAYDAAYQTAVAKGITIFVSSGDENADSCDAGSSSFTSGIGVSGFTSSAYDVSVGGTDFATLYTQCEGATAFPACFSGYWNATNDHAYGSAKSYMAEVPWNDSCGSVELAAYFGLSKTYGTNGLCNATTSFLNITGGSGGPSGCAKGKPLAIISEASENVVASGGAVGGTCTGWAKPPYQSLVGNPGDGVRDIPDLALFASNGFLQSYYIVCDSENNGSYSYLGEPTGCSTSDPENWAGFGGTSVSTPIMAGIQALINQKTNQSWGLVNTQYYQLARQQYGATGDAACDSSLGNQIASRCIFNDVTAGDMDSPCGTDTNGDSLASANCFKPSGNAGVLSTSTTAYQPAYGTNTGWDFSTGIGTVNAFNLVNAFAALNPPT